MSHHQPTPKVKPPAQHSTSQSHSIERDQSLPMLEQIQPALAAYTGTKSGRARPGDILQLQRAYGNRAVSDLIQAKRVDVDSPSGNALLDPVRQPIQRSKTDGQPDDLPEILTPVGFKKQTSSTLWTRGGYLKTIDIWLQVASDASTWDEQQKALRQVAEACDAWLYKHDPSRYPNQKSSIVKRRPIIEQVKQAINTTPSGSIGGLGQGSVKSGDEKENKTTVIGETLNFGPTVEGTAGDFSDIHGEHEGGVMGKGGGDQISNHPEISMLVLGDTFKGGLGLYTAITDKDKSNTEKAQLIMESLGSAAHGITKFSKGVALKKIGEESKGWDQVGDSGGACADGLAFVSGLISLVEGFRKQDAVTTQEKAEAGLNRVGEITTVAQAGLKTAGNIVNAATKGGATNAVAGLATASGALGIVLGSIEMLQGGIKIYRGYNEERKLQKAQAQQQELLAGVFEKLQGLPEQLATLLASGNQAKILELARDLSRLRATFAQLQATQQEFAPAMEAMKKIQNQKMEEGIYKAAKGGTAVVSGVLLLTGFGAPIAIGVAALGGIMALGYAGLKLRRDAAASRLTTTALRLTDDGQPKATPDPQAPDYRTMEKRIYKCYYNHLPEVIQGKIPPGLPINQFRDVKNFAWADKKERIGKGLDKKARVNDVSEIQSLSEDTRKNNWVEVVNGNGVVTHKEKPKGIVKVGLVVSASAHKSKQATMASKAEVVEALYKLASQSWNEQQQGFVNAPIQPIGKADPEMMKEYGKLTLYALLSAADINAARWKKWLDQSHGDEGKMKELIGAKIG